MPKSFAWSILCTICNKSVNGLIEEWSFLRPGSDLDGVLGGIWSAEDLCDGCEVDFLRLVSAKFCVKTYVVKALTKARCVDVKALKLIRRVNTNKSV